MNLLFGQRELKLETKFLEKLLLLLVILACWELILLELFSGRELVLFQTLEKLIMFIWCTGCTLKIVFFSNSHQPIPSTEESNSSDMRVTLIGWPFSVQPIAAQEREGEIAKY